MSHTTRLRKIRAFVSQKADKLEAFCLKAEDAIAETTVSVTAEAARVVANKAGSLAKAAEAAKAKAGVERRCR